MSRNSQIYWKLPLLLYAVTWLTTTGFRFDFKNGVIYQFLLSLMLSLSDSDLSVEAWWVFRQQLYHGILFSVPLMLILTCHELGHFIQMRRYGVRSSLPYFIPMPIGPFGTLGAVIAMDGHIPNARALFDIGISGPLAGLIPTLFCLYLGIKWSYFIPVSVSGEMTFGNPLLFQSIVYWIFGSTPPDVVLYLHPVGLAGWVGLFLTSLNLMPFGQLDGGHIFYALLGRRASLISWCVFYTVILLVIWFRLWHWSLILILLAWIGITHPPTANETVTLTPLRRILGWGILVFIVFGFTPTPIVINDPPRTTDPPRMYCRRVENTLSGNCLFLLTTKPETNHPPPYFYFNHENHECSRKDWKQHFRVFLWLPCKKKSADYVDFRRFFFKYRTNGNGLNGLLGYVSL